MGIFKGRKTQSGPTCPTCGSSQLGLGYVDRVSCTVLHTCGEPGGKTRELPTYQFSQGGHATTGADLDCMRWPDSPVVSFLN